MFAQVFRDVFGLESNAYCVSERESLCGVDFVDSVDFDSMAINFSLEQSMFDDTISEYMAELGISRPEAIAALIY